MVVVKVNGDKIRSFNSVDMAETWVKKYVHRGKVEIVGYKETMLPRASRRIHPDFRDLRYKPYEALN